MKKPERYHQLIALWLQRPPEKRTENDLFMFHADMEREHPELLSPDRASDHRYQELYTALRDHIRQ